MTQTNVATSDAFADPNQPTFLQQLVDDPSLRHELESDPIATLGRFGIEMDPALVPERVQLPNADALQSAIASDAKSARDVTTARWVPFLG